MAEVPVLHHRKKRDAPGTHVADLEALAQRCSQRNSSSSSAANTPASTKRSVLHKSGNATNALGKKNANTRETCSAVFGLALIAYAVVAFGSYAMIEFTNDGYNHSVFHQLSFVDTKASYPPSTRSIPRPFPHQASFDPAWSAKVTLAHVEITPDDHILASKRYPTFSNLKYYPVTPSDRFLRDIDPDDDAKLERYRNRVLRDIDRAYYSKKFIPTEDLEDTEQQCRRTSMRDKHYYTCNNVHDLTVGRLQSRASNDFVVTYLGHGHFRDAFRLDGSQTSTDFVVKQLRFNDSRGGYRDMHLVARDATVMERLTASPNIVSIYGLCGTTILSETIAAEVVTDIIPGTGIVAQGVLDQEKELTPRNGFTPQEKLRMALEMAEALADLHGFHEGVIFHGDTHPEQWLRAKDGSLKLNDFNNAVVMDYSDEYGTYCKPFREYGGFYRSPEEFVPTFLSEQIDTYSMGNNIYCLLTGLWPFYNEMIEHDRAYIQKALVAGKRPYVDPRWKQRSYAERKLVEIMEASWQQEPHIRISVFRMVELLRDAIREDDRRRRGGGKHR